MRALIVLLLLAFEASADVSATLDDYFSRLEAHGFSGAVIVARGEQVVLRKGYGFADRRRRVRARPDTAFNIASLDKQFIAAGILRLEEQGKLRVTDRLERFFDFLPEDKKGITLQQVLSHTAGLPDEYWDSYETLTRVEFIRKVLTEKALVAAPGTEHNYASFDYWLLEEVIERVSGMPFEAYLRAELFEPRGMKLTGAALPRWDRGNVAHTTLWTIPDDVLQGEARYTDPLARPPAWRVMLSTADDLHRWYLGLRGGAVLTAESRAKWLTPVMDGYAYGWNVVPTARGTRLVHHGGNGGFGSVATFRWFVDEDAFVVILNNSPMGGFVSDYVVADVEEILFGGSGAMPPPFVAYDESAIAKITGAYRLPRGGIIEVVRAPDGGPLVARSRDAEGIGALRLGGTADGKLPQDERAREVIAKAIAGDYEPYVRATGASSSERIAGMAAALTKDAGPLIDIATLHYRTFAYDGAPEVHAYVRVQLEKRDEYLRVIHFANGRIQLSRERQPPGIEAVLARSPHGGFTVWEPRLASVVRLHFDGEALRISGSGGSITATRVKER